MQFTTTFLMAALSGIAFALPQAATTACTQTSAIPTCGNVKTDDVLIGSPKVPCITSAASAAGCTNLACQCSSSAVIQASALNCVLGNCGLITALSVQAAAAAVCTACA
ncbi:hypothetical protein EDB81DRAFT_766491 [Dactylonectria macrodidyma]|uniref:Extracellular membrane protein CFEM domain-containing protein n=1 Tax=Dactylonectria macrodidyma TaxID=307937 RepID=A0A9P9DLX9_9HYPO|nr:hypothetical protein EDB81DRAFT_766491 [Dactylonectria macrodidyma]